MSRENVEIVRRTLEIAQEGIRRGDHGAAFDEGVVKGLIASTSSGEEAEGQAREWQGFVTLWDARDT